MYTATGGPKLPESRERDLSSEPVWEIFLGRALQVSWFIPMLALDSAGFLKHYLHVDVAQHLGLLEMIPQDLIWCVLPVWDKHEIMQISMEKAYFKNKEKKGKKGNVSFHVEISPFLMLLYSIIVSFVLHDIEYCIFSLTH